MKELPLAENCRIIEETEDGIVVLEKGHGVLSHPNPSKGNSNHGNARTIIRAEYDHEGELYALSPNSNLHMTHRLDSPTSGLMLATYERTLAKEIKNLFKARAVNKTYHAIVVANDKLRKGIWTDLLEEKRTNGKLRVIAGKGMPSKAECFVEKFPSGPNRLALLRLRLHTGRTHQLRVQAAVRRLPILGDRTYGDFTANRKIARKTGIERLCLHASGINLKIKDKKFAFHSPMPQEFEEILAGS